MPRPTTGHRLAPRSLAASLALLLALPVGLASAEAEAARPKRDAASVSIPGSTSGSTADATADADALDRAKAQYEEGQACFDTFDYEGAVERWTAAYATVPASADWVRTRLVYNIATAQQLAYDVDRDVGHLRQAVMLLEQYTAEIQAQHDPDDPELRTELEQARIRIDELTGRIERAQAGRPDAATPVRSLDGIVWRPSAVVHDPQIQERNRLLARQDRTTDRMLVASTVTLSVGGLLTLAGAGAVAGTGDGSPTARGSSYGTLAVGLAGLTTGITLLAVGLQRRKRAKKGTLVTMSPVVGPRLAGGTVSVRF